MTTCTKITGYIDTSDPTVPLGMEIWLDQQRMLDVDHVTQAVKFEFTVSDDPAQHVLKFVMKNKQPQHTTIDDQGTIIKDVTLKICDLALDEIELRQVFLNLAQYHHDFNGHGQSTVAKFYGEMGCNGTVELKFETPVYMWLLENM
jgi:light-regulated signal transduction histidine kinase (bacteriophytochrome)